MTLKLNDYNVESETAEVSLFLSGEKGTITRTVSRDALIILMDKLEKGDLPAAVPEQDRSVMEAIKHAGGLIWLDTEVNKLEKF